MEIYQAAELQERMELDLIMETCSAEEKPWECYYSELSGTYDLALNHRIARAYSSYSNNAEGEHVYITITKQRGGTRRFKTFEAVMSALRQIGQQTVKVYV